MRHAVALIALLAAGCTVHEGAVALGPRGAIGYHVAAGSAAPQPDFGFALTANGQGGYRLFFSNRVSGPTVFSATLTTDGTFDPQQTKPLDGRETLSMTATTVTVGGTPSTAIFGVDVVPSTDPLYVDATADGSRTSMQILFVG